MFKCAITGKISQPGEKPVRLITKRREVKYLLMPDGAVKVHETASGLPEGAGQIIGSGWEIAKEALVTTGGAAIWQAKNGS